MKCPHCGDKLLQKADDGSTKLRLDKGPLVARNGALVGNCYWCRKSVSIPLEEIQKSEALPTPAKPGPSEEPAFIIGKRSAPVVESVSFTIRKPDPIR